MPWKRIHTAAMVALGLLSCASFMSASAEEKKVTLLFTNDVESAYDPIPAFWLDDLNRIGGIAEMTTLINEIRATNPRTFLFDAGDIFTGALAKETQGALAFDLMALMGYDALGIGNHEFEYGVEVFGWQKNRAPFPVLSANMFYRGTDHPFAQAHTIIEKDGVRIGVVAIMGRDAVSAIIPAFIAPLDVTDEAAAVQKSVDAIRDEVDIVVLLTHQGKTAPMQTDAETDPRTQRDIDADIRLAGAVRGVDVMFSGHADAGTPEPVIHPTTGTIIMQTYGQATHLGFLELTLDDDRTIQKYDGKLIPVDADRYAPDPVVRERIEAARARFPELFEVIGRSDSYMNRKYMEESTLGNLFADIFREAADTDIAFIHPGSLRKDLPAGDIRRVDVLDVYPFIDHVLTMTLDGRQVRDLIEQSLTFERGLLEISGFEVTYDLSKPEYSRVFSLTRGGKPIQPTDTFTAGAPTIIANGADLFTTFTEVEKTGNAGLISEILLAYFARHKVVRAPALGRQTDVTPK